MPNPFQLRVPLQGSQDRRDAFCGGEFPKWKFNDYCGKVMGKLSNNPRGDKHYISLHPEVEKFLLEHGHIMIFGGRKWIKVDEWVCLTPTTGILGGDFAQAKMHEIADESEFPQDVQKIINGPSPGDPRSGPSEIHRWPPKEYKP